MVYGPPTPAMLGLKFPEGETPGPLQLPPTKSVDNDSALAEIQICVGAVITGVTGATTFTMVLSLAAQAPEALAVIANEPAAVGVNNPVAGFTPVPLQVTPASELTNVNGAEVEHTGATSVMATVGV